MSRRGAPRKTAREPPAPHSGTLATMTTPPPTWRPLILPVVGLYVAPWLVYLVLLRLQPDDRFAIWHGDVAWPAASFLTVSQGGLFMPIFAHVMAGLIGGLFLGMLVVALVRLACHLLRARDVSGTAGAIVMYTFPFYVFMVVKAVPQVVTVIDPAAQQLTVHQFHPVLRYPESTLHLRGADLRALDLAVYWHKRSGTDYAQIFALTADNTLVKIAERACEELDPEACLTAADPDLAELARTLGRTPRPPDTTSHPRHHSVLLDP